MTAEVTSEKEMFRRLRPFFPCSFLPDIVCRHKTRDKNEMLDQCESCEHYLRFYQEMEDAEAKEDAEMLEYYEAERRGETHNYFEWIEKRRRGKT
jgi:hypothetical protein